MDLEDEEATKDIVAAVEQFVKASSQEKAARMKYTFQLNTNQEVVEMAG